MKKPLDLERRSLPLMRKGRRKSIKRLAAIEWMSNNPDEWKAYHEHWKDNHRGQMAAYQRTYMRQRRLAALYILSGDCIPICVRCGESDNRILQIDHIEACKGKRHALTTLYGMIIRAYLEGREDFLVQYQVLCPTCNWLKRIEEKESRTRTHDGPDCPVEEGYISVSDFMDELMEERSRREEDDENVDLECPCPGLLGVKYRTKVFPDDYDRELGKFLSQ